MSASDRNAAPVVTMEGLTVRSGRDTVGDNVSLRIRADPVYALLGQRRPDAGRGPEVA